MGGTGKGPAVERAREAWAEMAYQTRTELRAIGVTGTLRRLANVAAGTRGMNAPTQLTALAVEMRNGGLSEAVAAARLTNVAQQIAALVYRDGAA